MRITRRSRDAAIAANKGVKTRQVVRARLVEEETARINKEAGGEPRFRRRAMARAAAKRRYRELERAQ